MHGCVVVRRVSHGFLRFVFLWRHGGRPSGSVEERFDGVRGILDIHNEAVAFANGDRVLRHHHVPPIFADALRK